MEPVFPARNSDLPGSTFLASQDVIFKCLQSHIIDTSLRLSNTLGLLPALPAGD